ncbi:MAG TPA: M14 family zinc carboxypeptidase [Solirubrobacteraceae bacterium]
MRPPRRARAAALIAATLAVAAGCGAAARDSRPTGFTRAAPRAAAKGVAHRSQATRVVIGRSVRGRPIVAVRLGDPAATLNVLVVGVVHGDEQAGLAVTARLRGAHAPPGVALWIVDRFNPDGAAAGTRQNAHGVDLNRNFPFRWRALPRGTFYSGPRPLSEPEARAALTLIRRIRPAVTIWYHQHARLVDESGGDPTVERRYAELVGLPFERFSRPPGSITSWQNHTYPGTTAMVVELPAGSLPARSVTRHVSAVLALARGERSRNSARPGPSASAATAPASSGAVPQPPIVQRLIPFGAQREREMQAYALRHYGIDDYRLKRPQVVVEHFSDTNSAQSVYDIFRPDHPDAELHELPNTCAHFVIDRDGTIYQLVALNLMCRHVLGLNYTAIGIEHVGFSDVEVMGDAAQLRASLALTRWLRCTYGVALTNVIGHAESLGSPFYRENVARLRGQTHNDFGRPAMTRYRSMLAQLGC